MGEQYTINKIKEDLKNLALYLHNDFYRKIYNDMRNYLVKSDTLRNTKFEDVSRDDVYSALSYRITEDIVFKSLEPVYIFYDEPFKCLNWLKATLKGIDNLLAEKVKSCWLLILQSNNVFGSEKEQYANVIIDNLSAFDINLSDVDALDSTNADWIVFFTGKPGFAGYKGSALEETIRADFAVRGFRATQEEQLAKMIKKNPVTALKVTNELFEGVSKENVKTGSRSEGGEVGTTARQVLIIHYMLEYLQVRGIDAAVKARFINYLTGKNYKNIYDLIRSPLATKEGNFRSKDLQEIRPFFEDLGLTEIAKMINNELDRRGF